MKFKIVLLTFVLIQIYNNVQSTKFRYDVSPDIRTGKDYLDYIEEIKKLPRSPIPQYPKPAPHHLIFMPPVYPNEFTIKHLFPLSLDNQRLALFGLYQPSFRGPLQNQKNAILTEFLIREGYLKYLNPYKDHTMFPNLQILGVKIQNSGLEGLPSNTNFVDYHTVTCIHATGDELIRKIDPVKYAAAPESPVDVTERSGIVKSTRTVTVELAEGVAVTDVQIGVKGGKLVLRATQYTDYKISVTIDVAAKEILHYTATDPVLRKAKLVGTQDFEFDYTQFKDIQKALYEFPYKTAFGKKGEAGHIRQRNLLKFMAQKEKLVSFEHFRKMLTTAGLDPDANLNRPDNRQIRKNRRIGGLTRILGEKKPWDVEVELRHVPDTLPCRQVRSVVNFGNNEDDDYIIYNNNNNNKNRSSSHGGGNSDKRLHKRSASRGCSYTSQLDDMPKKANNKQGKLDNVMDMDATDLRKVQPWKKFATARVALPMLVSVYQIYNGWNLLHHGIRTKDVATAAEGIILLSTESGTLLAEIGLTMMKETNAVQKTFRFVGMLGLGIGTVMGTWEAGKDIYKGTNYLNSDNPFYQRAGKFLIVKGVVSVPFLVIGVAAFVAGGPAGIIITLASMAIQMYINSVLSKEIEENERKGRAHDLMKPIMKLYTLTTDQLDRAYNLRKNENTMPYLLPDDAEILLHEFNNFTGPLVQDLNDLVSQETFTFNRIVEPYPTLVPPTPICTIQQCTYREEDGTSKFWFSLNALLSLTDSNIPPGINCTKADNSCYFYGICKNSPSLRCASRKEESRLYQLLTKCECPVNPKGGGYRVETRTYDQTRRTEQRMRKDFENIYSHLNLTCEVENYVRVIPNTSDLYINKWAYESNGYLVVKKVKNSNSNNKNNDGGDADNTLVNIREGNDKVTLSGKAKSHNLFSITGPGIKELNGGDGQAAFRLSDTLGGKLTGHFTSSGIGTIISNLNPTNYDNISFDFINKKLTAALQNANSNKDNNGIVVSINENVNAFIGAQNQGEFMKISCGAILNGMGGANAYTPDTYIIIKGDDDTCTIRNASHFQIGEHSRIYANDAAKGSINIVAEDRVYDAKMELPLTENFTWNFVLKQFPASTIDSQSFFDNACVSKSNNGKKKYVFSFIRKKQSVASQGNDEYEDKKNITFTVNKFDSMANNSISIHFKNDQPDDLLLLDKNEKLINLLILDNDNLIFPLFVHDFNVLKTNNSPTSVNVDYLHHRILPYYGVAGFPNLFKITDRCWYFTFIGGEKDDVFHVSELIYVQDVVLRVDGKEGWNSIVRDPLKANGKSSNNLNSIVTLDWTNGRVSNVQEIRGDYLNVQFSAYDKDVTTIQVSNSVVNITFDQPAHAHHHEKPFVPNDGGNDDDKNIRIQILRNATVNFLKSKTNLAAQTKQLLNKTIQLQYDGNSNRNEDMEENITFDSAELFQHTSIVLFSNNFSDIHFSQKYINSTNCVVTTIQGKITATNVLKINIHTKVDNKDKITTRHDIINHFDIPQIIVAFDEKTRIVIYKNADSNKIFASLQGIKTNYHTTTTTTTTPTNLQKTVNVVGVHGVANIINLSYQLIQDIDKGRVQMSGISKFETILQIENSQELANNSIEMYMTTGLLTINHGKETYAKNFEFLKEIDAVVGRQDELETVLTSICNTKEIQYIDTLQIVDTNGGQPCQKKNTNSSNGNIMSISMFNATTQLYNDESNGSFIYTIDDFHPVFRHIKRAASLHHYNFQFNILNAIEFMWVHQKSNTLQITTRPGTTSSSSSSSSSHNKPFSINLPDVPTAFQHENNDKDEKNDRDDDDGYDCDDDYNDIKEKVLEKAVELPIYLTFRYDNTLSGYITIYRKGSLRKYYVQEDTIMTHIRIGPDHHQYYHHYDEGSNVTTVKTIAGSNINVIEIDILNDDNDSTQEQAFGIDCDMFSENRVILISTVRTISFLALKGSYYRRSSLTISEQFEPNTPITFRHNHLYKQDNNLEKIILKNISGLNNLIGRATNYNNYDIAYVDYNLNCVANFATIFLEPPNDEIQSDLQDLSFYPYRYDIDIHLSFPSSRLEFLARPLPKAEENENENNGTERVFMIGTFGKLNIIRIHVPMMRNLDLWIPIGSWSDLYLTYHFNFSSREIEKLAYVEQDEKLYYTVNSKTFHVHIQQEYTRNISIVFTDLFKLTISMGIVMMSSNYDFDTKMTKTASSHAPITDTQLLLRYRYEADKIGGTIQTMHNNQFVFVLPRNSNNTSRTTSSSSPNSITFSAPNGNSAYYGGLQGSIYQITNPLNNTFISTGIEEPPTTDYNTATKAYWQKWLRTVTVEEAEYQTIDIVPIQKSLPTLMDSDLRINRLGSHIVLTTTTHKDYYYHYNGIATNQPPINVTVIFGHFYWVRPYLRVKTATSMYSLEYDTKAKMYTLLKTGVVINNNQLHYFHTPTEDAVDDDSVKNGNDLPSPTTFNFYLSTELADGGGLLDFNSYLVQLNNSLCIANVQQHPTRENVTVGNNNNTHNNSKSNSILANLSAIFFPGYFNETINGHHHYNRTIINVWFAQDTAITLKDKRIYYYNSDNDNTNNDDNHHSQQKYTLLSSRNFLKDETLLHPIQERVEEALLNQL